MAVTTKNFFVDEDFQDHLVALLCQDIGVLRRVAPLLQVDDFKPLRGMRWGRPRWIVAERALEYFRKYRRPLGRLLRADVLRYASKIGMGQRQLDELVAYITHARKLSLVGPEAITEMVVEYKQERRRAAGVQELVDLEVAGQLTDEAWHRVSQAVLGARSGDIVVSDYFATLRRRVERRREARLGYGPPMFFIDPLDSLVRGIGPGQLGVVIGPLKRGKSLFLAWLAMAYTVQRLGVMFVTLEDPVEELEDRLDAAVTGIPIQQLADRPGLVRRRFRRFRRLLRTQLKTIDGTQEALSVAQIEQIMLQEREAGFHTDALLIDYDDEIRPPHKTKERRFELADIYRELGRVARRHRIIVWTAAQTQRGTGALKVLAADKVAEDISKIRKATLALSLGQGDWGPDSIHLWVAAHKFDVQHVGCTIVPDKKRMLIYDRDRTRRAKLEYEEGEVGEDE